jgi:hypothetical protein
VIGYVTDRVTERLDSTISVSVVVAQYRDLGEEERATGLDNDIARMAVAALVPRAVWKNKPTTDPRVLGEVYFGYPNAYATTPVATLLRNFGPLSIAVGMALVGLVLGIAHKTLAASGTWTGARAVVYILCITRATNLEASLATFLPDASRLIIISLVTIGAAWCVSRVIDAVAGVAVPPAGSPAIPPGGSPGDEPRVAARHWPRSSPSQLIVALVALTCVAGISSLFV